MVQRRNSWPLVCAFGLQEAVLKKLQAGAALLLNSLCVRLQMIFNSKETWLLKGSRLFRPVRDTTISMNDRQKYLGLKVNITVL